MGRLDNVKPINIKGVWYKAVEEADCCMGCDFDVGGCGGSKCNKPEWIDWIDIQGVPTDCINGFYILKKCDKDGVITNSKSTNEIEQEVNVTQAKDETEVLVNAFGKEVARNYYLCRSFLVREFSERHEADFLRIAKELE